MLSLCKEPLLEKPIVHSCLKSLYWLDLCSGCSTHCLPLIVTLFTVQKSYKKKKGNTFCQSWEEKKRQYVFAHTYSFYNILLNTVWPRPLIETAWLWATGTEIPLLRQAGSTWTWFVTLNRAPCCWEIFIPLPYWLTSPELVPPHTSQHHMSSKWVVIWNP